MKLKNLCLVCLAGITCIAWLKVNRNFQVFNELLNAREQSKTKHVELAVWLARINSRKLKHILIWPSKAFIPFNEMATGQGEFIKLNCPVINCFVTANISYFKDVRRFDFIAFMGRQIYEVLGNLRSEHQRYIYFNLESSNYYPVEDKYFDGFFNWTATYRLDSDIPMPYIQIKDMEGNIVGPKINMEWVPEVPIDAKVLPDGFLSKKSQAAAIFYSNCRSLSLREELIADIRKALKRYGLDVDVFGSCGPYRCPRNTESYCNEMLMKEYYFYLSFENAFDTDYVTEKLLTAVQNYVVPVVLGGANYSRFLPPGSYLDASTMFPEKLAYIMMRLMSSPNKYLQFFWWRKYYTYHNPLMIDNVCNLCAAMNNEQMLKRKKSWRKFRMWWNNNSYD